MSSGICGKRVGSDDIFGLQPPSAKRSRCYNIGFGSEDKLSALYRMFPLTDRKVVESILDSHDNKIDDAIKNLNALYHGNDCEVKEELSLNAALLSNHNGVQGAVNEQTALHGQDVNSENSSVSQNGPLWEDLFVQEMTNASNWDDVRGRTAKLLEAFEKSGGQSMASKEEEIASLKEQLQCMFKDNSILKRGIQIQHERYLEQEEKLKEVPQLKQFIIQCQEQIRKLEMDNYTLRIYLQRAQEFNSIPSHYNRDIF